MSNFYLNLVLCLVVFAGYLLPVESQEQVQTPEQVNATQLLLKMLYVSLFIQCAQENPLTEDILGQLKQRRMPEDYNTKCLFACVYKRAGIMDQQGFLSLQGVHNMTKKYFTGSDLMERAMKFTDACKGVNDVSVSDGEKGCERAALLFNCSVEKAPEFQFDLGV